MQNNYVLMMGKKQMTKIQFVRVFVLCFSLAIMAGVILWGGVLASPNKTTVSVAAEDACEYFDHNNQWISSDCERQEMARRNAWLREQGIDPDAPTIVAPCDGMGAQSAFSPNGIPTPDFDSDGFCPDAVERHMAEVSRQLDAGKSLTDIQPMSGTANLHYVNTSFTINNSLELIHEDSHLGGRRVGGLVGFEGGTGAGIQWILNQVAPRQVLSASAYRSQLIFLDLTIGTGVNVREIVGRLPASGQARGQPFSGWNGGTPQQPTSSNRGGFTFGLNSQNIGGRTIHRWVMIRNLTLPEGLQSIGSQAFAGAHGSVTWGDHSYRPYNRPGLLGGGIWGDVHLTIPSTVNYIGDHAFSSTWFSIVSFRERPQGGTLSLNVAIFAAATRLHMVRVVNAGGGVISNNTLPRHMQTTIPGSTFSSTRLSSITIPRHIQTIGNNAFCSNPNLGSVNFETSSQLTTIQGSAFRLSTALASVNFANVPQGLNIQGDAFAVNATGGNFVIHNIQRVGTIGSGAFRRRSIPNLNLSTFSNNNIGYRAFADSTTTMNIIVNGGFRVGWIQGFRNTRVNSVRQSGQMPGRSGVNATITVGLHSQAADRTIVTPFANAYPSWGQALTQPLGVLNTIPWQAIPVRVHNKFNVNEAITFPDGSGRVTGNTTVNMQPTSWAGGNIPGTNTAGANPREFDAASVIIDWAELWNRRTAHSVRFDGNGGQVNLANITADYRVTAVRHHDNFLTYRGSPISLLTPTRAGHTFAGWRQTTGPQAGQTWNNAAATHHGLSARPVAQQEVTQQRIYQAQWTINRHTTTFNLNTGINHGGMAVTGAALAAGTTATITQDWNTTWANFSTGRMATSTSHVFVGWYNTSAATGGTRFIGGPVTGNQTLWARWTPKRFQVNLNLNSPVPNPNPNHYAAPTALTAAQATQGPRNFGAAAFNLPVLNDTASHTFAGWYTTSAATGGTVRANGNHATSDAAALWSPNTNYAGIRTANLWARWTVRTHQVTMQSGLVTDPHIHVTPGLVNRTATHGQVVPNAQAQTVTRTGFTFVRWRVSAAVNEALNPVDSTFVVGVTRVFSPITVEAVWQRQRFNITVQSADIYTGSIGGVAQFQRSISSVSGGVTNATNIAPGGGGHQWVVSTYFSQEGSTVTITANVPAGFRFVQWNITGPHQIVGGSLFTPTITVGFSRGAGWYNQANPGPFTISAMGVGTSHAALDGEVRYNVNWGGDPRWLHPGQHTVSIPETGTVVTGQPIFVSGLTPWSNSYYFDGWGLTPQAVVGEQRWWPGSGTNPAITQVVGGTTFYARWRPRTFDMHNVFEANRPSNAFGTILLPVPDATFSHTFGSVTWLNSYEGQTLWASGLYSHYFDGWHIGWAAPAEGVRGVFNLQPRDIFLSGGQGAEGPQQRLWAVWRPATHNIIFNFSLPGHHRGVIGAEAMAFGQSFVFGEDICLENVTEIMNRRVNQLDSHRFRHWSLTPGGDAITMVPGESFHGTNRTLFAVWEARPFQIHFDHTLPNPRSGDGYAIFPNNIVAENVFRYGTGLAVQICEDIAPGTLFSLHYTYASHRFLGWAFEANASAPISNIEWTNHFWQMYVRLSNGQSLDYIMLFPVWEANSFYVQFFLDPRDTRDESIGVNATAPGHAVSNNQFTQRHTYNSILPMPNVLSNTHELRGWYLTRRHPDGRLDIGPSWDFANEMRIGEKHYFEGENGERTYDMMLSAVWEPRVFTLTFESGVGGTVNAPMRIFYGRPIGHPYPDGRTVIADPRWTVQGRELYRFVGWQFMHATFPQFVQWHPHTTMEARDITITARRLAMVECYRFCPDAGRLMSNCGESCSDCLGGMLERVRQFLASPDGDSHWYIPETFTNLLAARDSAQTLFTNLLGEHNRLVGESPEHPFLINTGLGSAADVAAQLAALRQAYNQLALNTMILEVYLHPIHPMPGALHFPFMFGSDEWSTYAEAHRDVTLYLASGPHRNVAELLDLYGQISGAAQALMFRGFGVDISEIISLAIEVRSVIEMIDPSLSSVQFTIESWDAYSDALTEFFRVIECHNVFLSEVRVAVNELLLAIAGLEQAEGWDMGGDDLGSDNRGLGPVAMTGMIGGLILLLLLAALPLAFGKRREEERVNVGK